MHSSTSLNWLSRTPDYVGEINSPAWNGSSIYCRGDAKEVAEAYSNQYKKDLEIFLNARAEELVGEGLMALVLGVRENGVPLCQTPMGKILDFLGSCLFDVAAEGLISKEKLESFNLPQHYPSESEIEELINITGCFSIKKVETILGSAEYFYNAQIWSMIIRAALESILQNHFGNEIVEELFQRYPKKHAENLFIFYGNDVQRVGQINIVLKLKVYAKK